MIERKTILDQVEITSSGMQIRLAFILEEDGTEISRNLHRTVVNANEDVQTQMDAVNLQFSQMIPKMANLPQSLIEDLKAYHQVMKERMLLKA